MFYIDSNNDITMSKGETVTLTVPLFNTNKTKYTMKSTDKLYLTLKNNLNDTTSTMQVSSNAGSNVIAIVSADTVSLEAGIYNYDILLKTSDSAGNAIYNYIIQPRIFNLLPTVTDLTDLE